MPTLALPSEHLQTKRELSAKLFRGFADPSRLAILETLDLSRQERKERLETLLDELSKKARAVEADRDLALARNPYFDYGQALLQIAIVLASVAILTPGILPLIASITVGLLGITATVGGFTLAFPLPFS